jgi:hypothetical protein
MKAAPKNTGLRIVDQIRTMHLRGYELADERARLRLDITSIETAGVQSWRVEAGIKLKEPPGMEPLRAAATGDTRADALHRLARTCEDQCLADRDIARFDWERVEALLVEVRAL